MRKFINGLSYILMLRIASIPGWVSVLALWGFLILVCIGALWFIKWSLFMLYPYFGAGGIFIIIFAALGAGAIMAMRKG